MSLMLTKPPAEFSGNPTVAGFQRKLIKVFDLAELHRSKSGKLLNISYFYSYLLRALVAGTAFFIFVEEFSGCNRSSFIFVLLDFSGNAIIENILRLLLDFGWLFGW